jgi:hypothetical protein
VAVAGRRLVKSRRSNRVVHYTRPTYSSLLQAQLLAGFGGAGFAPATSKGLSFRPPAFGRGQPLPLLARVAEEGDTGGIDGGAPLHAPLQASTPPQQPRPQRCAVTPLTVASGPQHQDGGPMMQELPPLQSPLPPPMRPSGAMPRGGINRTETADSYTSQVCSAASSAYVFGSGGIHTHELLPLEAAVAY